MHLSIDDRKARLRQVVIGYDRQDLLSAEFRRLLHLAHTEGLLAGFLQEIGVPDHQVPFQVGESVCLSGLGKSFQFAALEASALFS